ncbi:hypothetical protein D3C71_2180290 [compost metagenome]
MQQLQYIQGAARGKRQPVEFPGDALQLPQGAVVAVDDKGVEILRNIDKPDGVGK